MDKQLWLSIKLALVCQTLKSDLVQSIGSVADKFTKEDLLVGVEGIDDKTEKLVDLSLKSERLGLRHCRSI
ncbi:hypothetical protein EI012_27695 [Escherichia coli]|nr:hypothetical protein [Escherichia coli]